jgi:hypothetical protein
MNEFNKGILLLFIFLLSLEIFAESKRKLLWVLVCSLLFAAGSIGAAVVRLERFEVSLAVSVIMTAICLGYLWFERATRRREKAARRQAVKMGVAAADVEREMMCAKDISQGRLSPVRLARYSLVRRDQARKDGWSFIRRSEGQGADYGNSWRLVTNGAGVSEAMSATLRAIAAQARGECLEFEASGGEVCAYWKEWGGSEQAENICLWLQELSQY